MSENQPKIVDLDNLNPQKVIIRFGGQDIPVNPPKVKEVFALQALSQRFSDTMTEEEAEQRLLDCAEIIWRAIPEIANKPLDLAQTLKLIKILSDLSIPEDTKELDKRGISPADPKAE